MTRPSPLSLALWLAAICAATAGCFGLRPKPDTTRFFVLTEASDMTTLAAGGKTRGENSGLKLGLGPLALPAYLDRPQIVRRVSPSRLEVSENDRWGEPLAQGFARVVATNLSRLLETDDVFLYPWRANTKLDYTIEIDVIRFEPSAVGSAECFARWIVRDGSTKRALVARETHLTRHAVATTTEVLVGALSELLADLSREIASGIESLREGD